MSITEGWNHKDEWRKSGNGFMVSVSRHHFGAGDVSEDENRWCVYAYVYPKHAIFDRLEKRKDAGVLSGACGLHCHSYVSFYQVHRDDSGELLSVQIGWDYNHDGDNYGQHKTPSDAHMVFYHAERLFAQLLDLNATELEAA